MVGAVRHRPGNIQRAGAARLAAVPSGLAELGGSE